MKLSLLKISKYKIFYHLARLSMPCFFLTVLFFSTVMDGAASFVSVVFALAILLLGNPRGFRLKWERNGWRALPRSLSVFVFSVSTVAFEAVLFAKNLVGYNPPAKRLYQVRRNTFFARLNA
jgi:hypothetical protein